MSVPHWTDVLECVSGKSRRGTPCLTLYRALQSLRIRGVYPNVPFSAVSCG